MSRYFRLLPVLALLCAGCRSIAQSSDSQSPASIIPEPVSTQWQKGSFSLNARTVIVADTTDRSGARFLNDYLQKLYGLRLKVVSSHPAKNYIDLTSHAPVDKSVPQGHYHLDVFADH